MMDISRRALATGLGCYFLALSSYILRLIERLSWSNKAKIVLSTIWILGLALTLLGLWALFGKRRKRLERPFKRLLVAAEQLPPRIKTLVIVLLIAIPMILIYSPLTARYARVGMTRLIIIVPFVTFLPLFWPWNEPEGMLARGLLSVVAVTTILISLSWLLRVRTSLFSLDWDEGNRLYDYSQYFGADRYLHAGPIDFAYSSLGRHGLWGLPFLFDGLLIWVHRLWDAIIRVIPAYLVGWLLVRHEESRLLKAGIAGAFGAFLLQERIYSTLLFLVVYFITLVPISMDTACGKLDWWRCTRSWE